MRTTAQQRTVNAVKGTQSFFHRAGLRPQGSRRIGRVAAHAREQRSCRVQSAVFGLELLLDLLQFAAQGYLFGSFSLESVNIIGGQRLLCRFQRIGEYPHARQARLQQALKVGVSWIHWSSGQPVEAMLIGFDFGLHVRLP